MYILNNQDETTIYVINFPKIFLPFTCALKFIEFYFADMGSHQKIQAGKYHCRVLVICSEVTLYSFRFIFLKGSIEHSSHLSQTMRNFWAFKQFSSFLVIHHKVHSEFSISSLNCSLWFIKFRNTWYFLLFLEIHSSKTPMLSLRNWLVLFQLSVSSITFYVLHVFHLLGLQYGCWCWSK